MHKAYATEKANDQLKCINVRTENLNTKLAYLHCISFCYPFPRGCWKATRVSSVRLPISLPFVSADKCTVTSFLCSARTVSHTGIESANFPPIYISFRLSVTW